MIIWHDVRDHNNKKLFLDIVCGSTDDDSGWAFEIYEMGKYLERYRYVLYIFYNNLKVGELYSKSDLHLRTIANNICRISYD